MASAIATSVSSSLTTQRRPSPSHSDVESDTASCCQERPLGEIFIVPPPPPSLPHPNSQVGLQELSTRTTELSLSDDELGSSDEVKVFKDEGDEEKEFISSEEIQAALLEDKSSLIQETELAIKDECAARLDLKIQNRHHGKLAIY